MQLTCPICGQPFDLSDLNLLGLFELYLLLTFIVSLALRFHQYRTNLMFLRQVPQRWPAMYTMIRDHAGVFLRWTMIAPVLIALTVFLVYFLAYRLIWTEADISWNELWEHPGTAIPVTIVGLAMLALDLSTLFRSSQWDYNQIEANLSRGETALTSRTMRVLRFLSLRFVDAERIVRGRVKDSIHYARLSLIDQLRRQSFHTAVRITCGFLLWIAWSRHHHDTRTALFTFSAAVVIGVLIGVLVWLRMPLWNRPADE